MADWRKIRAITQFSNADKGVGDSSKRIKQKPDAEYVFESSGYLKTIHQLPNLGDCENATGGVTRYRHEDSSPTFYGSQTAPSPQRLTKSADGSTANRWWG